jgi:hypothetical protein
MILGFFISQNEPKLALKLGLGNKKQKSDEGTFFGLACRFSPFGMNEVNPSFSASI